MPRWRFFSNKFELINHYSLPYKGFVFIEDFPKGNLPDAKV
jgi:hypothetical protein